jgi:hypothetical protein
VSRNRTALKKVGKSTEGADEAVFEEIEKEAEEAKEEKMIYEKFLCKSVFCNHISSLTLNDFFYYQDDSSKARKMPNDYIPPHFLSWLAIGPAVINLHPTCFPYYDDRLFPASEASVIVNAPLCQDSAETTSSVLNDDVNSSLAHIQIDNGAKVSARVEIVAEVP